MPADAAVAPVDAMADDAMTMDAARTAALAEAKANAEKAAQETEDAAREARDAAVRDAAQPTYYNQVRPNVFTSSPGSVGRDNQIQQDAPDEPEPADEAKM